MGSRDNLDISKKQSGTVDSIQEESHLIKSATPSRSSGNDEISEASYLKDEFEQQSDVPKSKPSVY